MKIQDQVVSLDQAKRLKELGVKQEGAVFYYDEEDGNNLQYNGSDYDIDSPDYGWSAFTVAELGVLIGNKYTLSETTNHKEGNKRWICGNVVGVEDGDYDYNYCAFGATEAQARAAMLIYLLENNIITVDEINSRI